MAPGFGSPAGLLRQLRRCGFQRAILAVGYQAKVIQSHFGDSFRGLALAYSDEQAALGAALRNAALQLISRSCLVMNGDSYTDVALQRVTAAHDGWKADVSLVVVPHDDREDGSVRLDEEGIWRRPLPECCNLCTAAG